MRVGSIARFSSRPTACASWASASTRCRMRSRNWHSSGCFRRLDQVGIRTHELFYMNRIGQEIWREPRGTDAGFEYPQFSIHRGRLQAVIYDAVRERLGESRIHTRSSAWLFHAGRRRRHRIFLRPRRVAPRDRARRHSDRRGRNSLDRPRNAVPERRPGTLERLDALARRDRLAEISDRPLDGDRGRDGRQAGCLSDR